MNLREALDLCTEEHARDWVRLPGERPATAMVAGLFDPGASEPELRALTGHSIAVYEPDARLSLVWPVAEEFEGDRPDSDPPEWVGEEFKHTRDGWCVVLLGGTPIWQARVWYLDWGSGIGGYVPDFQPVFGRDDENGTPTIERWGISRWAIGLTELINDFSHTSREWATHNPTTRLVPEPSKIHPIDAQVGG